MTIAQIVDFFGLENCPAGIQKLWQQKGSGLQTERLIARTLQPMAAELVKEGKLVAVAGGGDTVAALQQRIAELTTENAALRQQVAELSARQ